jgi:hypothetical protein
MLPNLSFFRRGVGLAFRVGMDGPARDGKRGCRASEQAAMARGRGGRLTTGTDSGELGGRGREMDGGRMVTDG